MEAVALVDWARSLEDAPLEHASSLGAPDAFRVLLAAADEESARAAYHDALNAVGHDHSGQPFAAVVPAVPLLVRVALECPAWSQFAALEVDASGSRVVRRAAGELAGVLDAAERELQ
jgi:hypothetical protein